MQSPLQVGLKEWAQAPNMTYPTTNPYQGIYWASAALAWAHTCGDLDSNVTCDPALAEGYVQNASYWWAQGDVVTRRTYYPVSNWDVRHLYNCTVELYAAWQHRVLLCCNHACSCIRNQE